MQPVGTFVDSRLRFQRQWIRENGVNEILSESVALGVVKHRCLDQVVSSFNPEFDVHRVAA